MPILRRAGQDHPADEPQEERRSDPFTREQIDDAKRLAAEYERLKGERESNREILRHLARLGKISKDRVDALYPPRRRKRKGD
jgi:hypothetical protein